MSFLVQISEPEDHNSVESDVFGIDLGTTNSLIAIALDDKVHVFKDQSDRSVLRSTVGYNDIGIPEVGENLEKSVQSIKRWIDQDKIFDCGNGIYKSAIELSSEILIALRHRVFKSDGVNVQRAVITVPAYFNEVARDATKRAANLAGIEVVRLINEPTAAILAHGISENKNGIYVVYDLGGGTFDISVVRLREGVFQVLAVNGDAHLGGDDFDEIILKIICSKIQCKYSIEPDFDKISMNYLSTKAKSVKEILSLVQVADVSIIVDQKTCEISISRAEFESAIAHIVTSTVNMVVSTLLDARVDIADVEELILVGGSTRIPIVKSELRRVFGNLVNDKVDPDEIVVIGAALQARALNKKSNKSLLIDVLPLSLGIETLGGLVEKVISRNTPIPVSKKQRFTNYVDGQRFIQINVCQGERELFSENKILSKFELEITPMLAMQSRITVEFKVDIDGLLTVTAYEEVSGAQNAIEINCNYGLNLDYVKKIVMDSVENFDLDIKYKELISSAKRILLDFDHLDSSNSLLTNQNFLQNISGLQNALFSKNWTEMAMLVGDINKIVD